MIVRIFKARYLVQYVLLFALTLLFWVDALLFPEKLITGSGFANLPAIDRFISTFPLIAVIISILVLYFQAILLNFLVEEHRMVERNQLITAAVYITMMSCTPALVQPSMMLIVNLIIILLLFIIMHIYGKTQPFSLLFDTGFLVGLASLLFFPSLYFIGFVLISLAIFQFFKWREWLIPIIGLITPYLFLVVYFFWFDELAQKYEVFISNFTFHIPQLPDLPDGILVIILLFSLLIIPGLGKTFKIPQDSTVEIRKKNRVVHFMFIFALLTTFSSNQNLLWSVYLLIIPLVVFCALFLSRLKKLFFAELIFSMILIAIIAVKLLNFS